MAPFLILILLLLPAVQAQTPPSCIPSTNVWYDVCDYDTKTCVISNAICPPYGSLASMLTGSARINPTQDKPWTFKVDPVDRLASNSVCVSNKLNAAQCIDAIKLEDLSNVAKEDLTKWSFTNADIQMGYLTVESLILNTQIYVELAGDVSVNSGSAPKCRVFEVSAPGVTLKDFTFDVGACLTFYQTPEQYSGNDAVIVAFSGESVAGGSVQDAYFIGPENFRLSNITEEPYSPPITAIRVQRYEYGTIDADQFTAHNIQTANINFTLAMWDYTAKTQPSISSGILNSTADKYYEYSPEITTETFLYKIAYADTPGPNVTATSKSVVNVSSILGPPFSLFKPSVTRSTPQASYTKCNYVYAEAAIGTFASLVTLLILIFVGKSAVEIHSDSTQHHLKYLAAKKKVEVYEKSKGLMQLDDSIRA